MIFLIKLLLKFDYFFRFHQLLRDNIIEFKCLNFFFDLFLFLELKIEFEFIKKIREKRLNEKRIFIDNNLFVFAFFR